MNYRLEVIPVPQEVLDRQQAIRVARKITSQMYGGYPKPYDFNTPEYVYFRSMMLDVKDMDTA